MHFFGYYLVERGLVTSAQVLEALDRQHSAKIPIGELARRTGKLTDEQVLEVLNRQKSEEKSRPCSKPFGQVAQEMGLLNEKDILTLLEHQIFHRKPIGEILVEMGTIDKAAMERELEVFLTIGSDR